MSGTDGPQDDAGRTTTEVDDHRPLADLDIRVPGMTILYHPVLERIGERTVLSDLGARQIELSRSAPTFAKPGVRTRRSLADPRISRRPIFLRAGKALGTVEMGLEMSGSLIIDRSASGTALEVDGEAVAERAEIATSALDEGVVIMLGNQIVVLLHLLDPAARVVMGQTPLIGESRGIRRLHDDIERVADLRVPVLLLGETGTGKELVAQAIHHTGPRRAAPFVAVNMAAIPGTLAAAELFGARKGAFTGADRNRRGHFERADGGTLFLDEIGDTPAEVQTLLLRALETGEIQSVGADTPTRPDVRLISATDTDLEAAISAGRFRAPVLHRLSGFVLYVPPLRARMEDFGRLLVHFLREQAEMVGEGHRLDAHHPWLPAPLVARLARLRWPGNVRQLRNVVRQLVIAHRGRERMQLPPAFEIMLSEAPEPPSEHDDPLTVSMPPRRASEIPEAEMIATLERHQWSIQASADDLGISRPALYYQIKKSRRIRTAADLGADEILAALEAHASSVAAAAAGLRVSESAMRRRMGQLRITQTKK